MEKQVETAGRLAVGIVWQGNPTNTGDYLRSVPLKEFQCLAKVPGVVLISLQVGAGTEQITTVSFPLIDLGSEFRADSLDDLAAALSNVDLVVTVETAVAHLAGALGVPVWVLVPVSSDWRWLLDRNDSPWYPTMRLFRQKRFGEWAQVFAEVKAELAKLPRNH